MGSSIAAGGNKLMSLYHHCKATEQILTQYITYYSGFGQFHASTFTPKIANIDQSKPGFKPVVVWIDSNITAGGNLTGMRLRAHICTNILTSFFVGSRSRAIPRLSMRGAQF